jgi:hypothetical protein
MKGTIFWRVTLCKPVQVHRRLLLVGYLLGLSFDPQDEVGTFVCKVGALRPNYAASLP